MLRIISEAVDKMFDLTKQLMAIPSVTGSEPEVGDFLAEQLAARGYRPRYINCHANSGHVRRSNHYWGDAGDFDQSRRGRTTAMRHVSELARKWGLRDGCTFKDCGHIDADRDGSQHHRSFRRRG